jgi:HlyD family secretion protein
MKSKRPLLILIVLVIVAGAGIWFYNSSAASTAVSEKDLITVPRVDFPQIIDEGGLLEAGKSTPITCPQVAGQRNFKLIRVVDEGTQVSEGDFLLELDGATFALNLRNAQASFQNQQENFQQSRSAFDTNLRNNELNLEQAQVNLQNYILEINQQADLSPAIQVETLKIQRDMAQSQVDSLVKKIDFLNQSGRLAMQIARSDEQHYKKQMEDLQDTIDSLIIRAPVAGVVIYRRDYNNNPVPILGNNVNATNPVMDIPDLSTMRVKVLVDEMDAGKVKVGQKARITVPSLQGMQFDGKVVDLSAILKLANMTRAQKIAEARVELDPGQDISLLRPGMSANVQIQVGIIPQAIAIPLSAIQERNGGSYVQVLRGDKKDYEWRAIELQANDESLAVVKTGLEAGDKIRAKPKAQ